ncbi:Neurocan core protein [Labeo rohita]|nr:C-type lectin BML-1 [Labeo rohita]KAI2663099.1 Neurocan core protein [Labeo rohita]
MYVTFSQHHEFVYVSTLMNWSNAQKYCRERYTDLATTDNQADHDELLKTGGMAKFWLGLSRTRVTDVFVWSDQSSSSFTKWQSGQPNGQLCVNVEVGYWFDRNCVDNVPFACYFDRKRQIMRVEVKSSQNLNDPAVMNEISVNMEQILKQKGLAQHAKLSWRTQSNGNVFQKKDQMSEATKQTCV